ncbi:MAG TPA: hypothetical protein PLP17_04020 [Oligoflexia bacterium]|nr:hypothetical protein [Oligoflexia bacterium]
MDNLQEMAILFNLCRGALVSVRGAPFLFQLIRRPSLLAHGSRGKLFGVNPGDHVDWAFAVRASPLRIRQGSVGEILGQAEPPFQGFHGSRELVAVSHDGRPSHPPAPGRPEPHRDIAVALEEEPPNRLSLIPVRRLTHVVAARSTALAQFSAHHFRGLPR